MKDNKKIAYDMLAQLKATDPVKYRPTKKNKKIKQNLKKKLNDIDFDDEVDTWQY